MECMQMMLPVAGRVLLGFFFVLFGAWNTYYWQPTVSVMRQKHIPLALFVLVFGIALESIAGVLVMLGLYLNSAVLLLIVFDVVAIFMFHPFWTLTGELRRLNTIIFITNGVAVLGALLLLLK